MKAPSGPGEAAASLGLAANSTGTGEQRRVISTDSAETLSFLHRCEQWLCDGYNYDLRYVATVADAGYSLFEATLFFNPLPPSFDNRLIVQAGPILAGQDQAEHAAKSQLIGIVEKALAGTVTAGGRELTLPRGAGYKTQFGSMPADSWFQPLTCRLIGAAPDNVVVDGAALDTALRSATPPFDGADDLRIWLGVRIPTSGFLSMITITVNPPVDVLIDRSGFTGDRLRLTLSSLAAADRSLVRLAVRAAPSHHLLARFHVADQVKWHDVSNGLFEGEVDMVLPDASAALTMLLIGSETVRRQWFLHPARAPNDRFAAVRQFDPELRMIRQGLFEDSDSRRFETAVAALLFVLGFSAAVQIETDSPDIVVATPAGRLVLVECTTRVADIGSKIGKLVDRRGALQKTLRSGNRAVDVTAALVCRLPHDQIAAKTSELRAMGILLAAAEDLSTALSHAQVSADADGILTQALHNLAAETPRMP